MEVNSDVCVCYSGSSSHGERELSSLVGDNDLEHICRLVEVTDGGPAWIQMMDRSTPTMSYQAWRRDPEVGLIFHFSRGFYMLNCGQTKWMCLSVRMWSYVCLFVYAIMYMI